MPWFRIDDSFYDHPKVFDAPDCAVALWVRAGTWSARNLTDGFVPTGMPARLCDDHERAVRELVNRGLWMRTSGGFRFHDWTEYQPSKAAVIESRQEMASGGRLGNHRRWHAKKGVSDPDCAFCQQELYRGNGHPPNRVPDAIPESGANPPGPARPVPKEGALSENNSPPKIHTQEPPRKCPKHQNNPNPPPCGACAEARHTNEQWHATRRQHTNQAPTCPHHPGQPAHNCAPCRSERIAADAEREQDS